MLCWYHISPPVSTVCCVGDLKQVMVEFEQADDPLVPDDDGVVTISTSTRLGSGSSDNIVIIHALLCFSHPLGYLLSSDDE